MLRSSAQCGRQKAVFNRRTIGASEATYPCTAGYILVRVVRGTPFNSLWSVLCRTINNNYDLKKTVYAAEQKHKDIQQKRKEWRVFQKTVDFSKLVFLDESGVNTGMTRLYGRAYKNERIGDAVPDVRFHTTTILSSVRLDGTIVPCIFEDALKVISSESILVDFCCMMDTSYRKSVCSNTWIFITSKQNVYSILLSCCFSKSG